MEKNRSSDQKPNQEIESPIPHGKIEDLPEKAPPENLHRFFRQLLPDIDESTDFHRGSRSGGGGHQLVAWSFIAAFIDALILFSIGCFFLLSFSLLVKTQTQLVVEFFGASLFQIGIYIAVSLIGTYMIMLRVFLGYSIGEWACGLRLGSLQQRLHRSYSLKVIARMGLTLVTGFFLLPFLSLVVGKDLVGHLVGLPLVQQKKS